MIGIQQYPFIEFLKSKINHLHFFSILLKRYKTKFRENVIFSV